MAVALLSLAGVAGADSASRNAINASPEQLSNLNLPYLPTGAGEKIAVAEPGEGIPELGPANASMPPAGPAGGQDGRVTIVSTPNDFPNSHATMVTGVIINTASGIAPEAQLFIAGHSTLNARLLNSQMMLQSGGNGASILNWSLGAGGDGDGNSLGTQWADWAALTKGPHPIQDKLVMVAGNEPPPLLTPLDNFNGITVAATSTDAYRQLGTYNGSAADGTRNITTDASPYGNSRIGRFKTDIVAPGGGDGVLLADPVVTGSAEDNAGPPATDDDGLNSDASFSGTSFAAAHVTGAAALLRDFGTQQGHSTDHRVLKSLLLNSASTESLRDHNGPWTPEGLQSETKNGHAIYIGWDADLGAGLLDVGQSLQNYAAGEMDPGLVDHTGWDLHALNPNGQNIYTFTTPAEGTAEIRATLAWDRFVQLNDADGDDLWDTGETFSASLLNDLDLEVWNLTLGQRAFFSTSDMDSIEHLRFTPGEGEATHLFALQVNFLTDFAGRGAETYALAWKVTAVPEPGVAAVIFALAFAALRRGRRRNSAMLMRRW